MLDLIHWLHTQLDEAERVARAVPVVARCVPPARWSLSTYGPDRGRVVMGTAYDFPLPTPEHAAHVVLHDPAAVLAQLDATRSLLQEAERGIAEADLEHSDPERNAARCTWETVVRTIARPYRRHRGWLREWDF